MAPLPIVLTIKRDETLRQDKAFGFEGAWEPYRSFGEAVVDKVLPGDLAASVPEQVRDGAPERDRAQEDQSEFLVVPRHITLATTAFWRQCHNIGQGFGTRVMR